MVWLDQYISLLSFYMPQYKKRLMYWSRLWWGWKQRCGTDWNSFVNAMSFHATSSSWLDNSAVVGLLAMYLHSKALFFFSNLSNQKSFNNTWKSHGQRVETPKSKSGRYMHNYYGNLRMHSQSHLSHDGCWCYRARCRVSADKILSPCLGCYWLN